MKISQDTYKTLNCLGGTGHENVIMKTVKGMTQKLIEKELEKQVVAYKEKIKSNPSLDDKIKFADYAEKFMQLTELAPKT